MLRPGYLAALAVFALCEIRTSWLGLVAALLIALGITERNLRYKLKKYGFK